MYNLYIGKTKNKLIPAIEQPFKTEEEFENYLMKTKDIFSDIFILKLQVNAGRDILDMVGIDKDNNIVIIENKNVQVTEDILPQILRYAIWAETNPDSIKAMWLESENRPMDVEIDWDKIDIRIIILAPSIKLTVPRLLQKINYNVELMEIKRFSTEDEQVILLNKLEEPSKVQHGVVRASEIYDRKYQMSRRNKQSVKEFFNIVEKIEKIIEKKKLKLDKKLNKYYVGFKFGFPLAFGVHWLGTKSFEIFFKVQPEQLSKFKKICPYDFKYDKNWKQVSIKYENINLKKLEKVFVWAYDSLAGE